MNDRTKSKQQADTSKLDPQELHQFTGSESLYRHPLNPDVVFTEGVKYLAEKASAYWLLDEIALPQRETRLASEGFQVWKLTVKLDRTAMLQCDDGDGKVLLTKPIPVTDFPLAEMTLYFTGDTIMLPTEY